HVIRFGSQIDSGNCVGLVLRLSESCRLGVGRGFGKRIDGSAFGESLSTGQSIGMNGNEKRSAPRACEAHALGQWNKAVVRACHCDLLFSPAFNLLAKCLRESQNNVLFQLSAGSLRSVVDTAVTGIHDDQRAYIAVRFDGLAWFRSGIVGGSRL